MLNPIINAALEHLKRPQSPEALAIQKECAEIELRIFQLERELQKECAEIELRIFQLEREIDAKREQYVKLISEKWYPDLKP